MENTFDLKKFLVENKLTNNSRLLKEEATKEELQKQVFDFINSQKVGAVIEKVVKGLDPKQKEQLTNQLQTLAEGLSNDFGQFKQFTEKGLKASVAENGVTELMEPEEVGAKVMAEIGPKLGQVLETLGVANIMSMGFLPAIAGMATDYFAGTDIINTASQFVGNGSAAAALSVVVGLLGGGILWRMGKAIKGEEVTGDTPLF